MWTLGGDATVLDDYALVMTTIHMGQISKTESRWIASSGFL